MINKVKLIIFVLGVHVACSAATAEGPRIRRIWTGANGQFPATIHFVSDDSVTLIAPDGEHLQLNRDMLSEKDQHYISNWENHEQIAAAADAERYEARQRKRQAMANSRKQYEQIIAQRRAAVANARAYNLAVIASWSMPRVYRPPVYYGTSRKYWVRSYHRRDGTYVSGDWRR